jgi:hypothetical protein
MKFNIKDYEGDYVMHCKTEKEAKNFCEYLNSIGKTWWRGGSYVKDNKYDDYTNQTAYNFNDGTYQNVPYFVEEGYTILEWSDFMNAPFTKYDLKTGDVILRRNGKVEIVNRELEMFICPMGFNDLNDTREDLTDKIDEIYDIIAVRRPQDKSECQFDAFTYKYGELVYDRARDTAEEMTLAEVCKLLGKNIKIIK